MLSILTVPLLALCSVSASEPAVQSPPSPPVMAAWYTSSHATKFPLSSVSWGKYNTMYYSFVSATSSADGISLDDSHANLLSQFVSNAQSHGVQAHVAVGSWLGSVWFSSNIATSESRTTFVKTLTDFVHKYKLDGIQFDWEYPGTKDVGCNPISAGDTSNYLEFLQELRKDPVGGKLTLSAAVSLAPFTDASGKPSADIPGFAQVFDYITLMNYDVWGPWSKYVGPNAPMADTCASPENQQGSAFSAIKAWTAAGMPSNKIVLGVASFGRSYSVSSSDASKSVPNALEGGTLDESGKQTPDEPSKRTDVHGNLPPQSNGVPAVSEPTLAAYPPFDASKQPSGDGWDDASSVDICGARRGPDGTFTFHGLVEAGFLNKDGTYANGIMHRYDLCSHTSFAYNPTSNVMISLDNAHSFTFKGKFIKTIGLRGFAMWEAAGDHDDILLDSIRKELL
ncbi:glycoside hydrolase family 18 protein [Suillus spraguei]|nr:glycoside hydrolase family 18 protein [Suillus spraguei]